MLKRYALWFGIILLLVGILGYIPAFAPNGRLLNVFAVNGLHNLVHVITGVAAIWAAITSERFARLFFQVFGIFYGIVAIIGLFYGSAPLLGVMAHNWSDFWLHVVLSVFSLYMGYAAYPATRHVVS